ncbi:hypothetical protein [uncultured virus]|uniref:Uncharacterized protein n=1 Tax=uncultured virus TaxID=340016 RepID=A0A218MLV4_9VIRU|nr:hypothetical protein [uncultured virus]
MALSKVDFNSINVTPAASKAIKFNSNNNGLETGDLGGSLVLLSTQTASSSATLSFTSGIDSTYKEYQFHFIDIHPASNNVKLHFNMSADSGSNYNVTKTTTFFRADHDEADSATALGYNTSNDLAQSTNFQGLGDIGNDNDQTLSGTLHLFNPSSTTFVKHFISTTNACDHADESRNYFVAGYGNTTSAIDAVQFKMSSGNTDSGTIKMYGVT